MPATKIPLLTLSVAAAATITERQAVAHDGTVAAAAGAMLGLSQFDAEAGDQVPVDTLGTSIATAGAAITAGQDLEIGAAGKLVPLAAGRKVAVALQAAAADGALIEVLLTP